MNITTAAGFQPAARTLHASALQINGIALAPVEHHGQRVMSLAMIDQVHQRPDGTAGRNFRENRSRLIAGEDFFEIDQPDEIRRLGFSRPQGGVPAMVLLLTETGYSMLVKSFTDDLAWDVQRQLVKSYFAKPATLADPMASLSPEHRALVALLFESSAIKAQQAAHAAELAAQAESIKRIEANQIAAVASVQSFTALGYSLFRDLGLSKIELGKLGRKATALSKARGITVDQVGDGRYGRVGSYHISVLDDALIAISN
ncbi:hypothetical protein F2P45_06310 [Massilia sp. CCM 8733]|uniref:KilA-N DNA-binding domain-containing protein n=1 Tax=Massilia mucilaginosa TaxID=2609282 RepID=A0ABX0NPA7_9BURK|nr:ORF6N domain-containing protein [Massilia mucilaginosa]NHZ88637.1 hypothetical protein [Massilia mucilaginosa]